MIILKTSFTIFKLLLFLVVLVSMSACFSSKKHIIYEANCPNSNLIIYAKSYSSIEPNITTLYLQFNKNTTIPYLTSTRNFFTKHHQQIPNDHIVWLQEVNDTNTKALALFIEESEINKKEFDAFAACLQKNYQHITHRFNNISDDEKPIRIHRNAFQINAIIYGSAEKYATIYNAPDGSKSLYIMPDGNGELYSINGKSKELLPGSEGYYGATLDPAKGTLTQWYIDSTKAVNVLTGFKNAKTGKLLNEDYQLLLKPYAVDNLISTFDNNDLIIYFRAGSYPDPDEFKAHKFLERKYGIVFAYPVADEQTMISVKLNNQITTQFLENKYPELKTNSIESQSLEYALKVKKWRPILNKKIQLNDLETNALANNKTIIFDWKQDAKGNEFIEIISYDNTHKSEKLLMKYFPNTDTIEQQ